MARTTYLSKENEKQLKKLIGKENFAKYKKLLKANSISYTDEQFLNNVNSTITTLESFGFDRWWESSNLLYKAFRQLAYTKILIPVNEYRDGLRELTGIEVNYTDLDRSKERFYHLRAVAELSYSVLINKNESLFPRTEYFEALATTDYEKFKSTQNKGSFIPIGKTYLTVRDVVGKDILLRYVNMCMNKKVPSNYSLFKKVRASILTIEYDDFAWYNSSDKRIAAFRQACYNDLFISFEDFKKGLEELTGELYTDSAFESSNFNIIREAAIEKYKNIFLC